VDQISVVGRTAQGVKLISLGDGERLRYVERVVALEMENGTENGDDTGDAAAADPEADDPDKGASDPTD
jgi:DNA gyrase subunit A